MSRKRVLTLDEDSESVDSTKFQEDHKVSHLKAVKRILGYVKRTQHLGLWYPKDMRVNVLVYADSYHAAERACQQALWMKQAFMDYNIMLDEVPILCDDKCDINLTSSPIDYPRTNHTEIRHHFLKDIIAKKHITIDKISLEENVANILTKPLEKDQLTTLE
ncbi:hypothetical protein Tco_0859067 [Tanacetum coccineum]|uniref:Copia protein n=1 Tax=Tanacetum coccineum TaxID=301880 RepID=A0ABQ5BB25_9ASTR